MRSCDPVQCRVLFCDPVQFDASLDHAASVHACMCTIMDVTTTVTALHAWLWDAGKTHLASRLAQMYGLLHVTPHAVLAELQYVDATTQQVRVWRSSCTSTCCLCMLTAASRL